MSEMSVVYSDRIAERKAALNPVSVVIHKASLSFVLIWLFIVAIYARPEDIFPSLDRFHLPLILGICATAALLWSIFFEGTSLEWPRELIVMLLLTAWFAAGVPFAYWRGGSFDVLTQVWLKTLLIFFLLAQTLVTLGRIRAILWAIILSELVVTAYSILASSDVTWMAGRMFGVSKGILGWNFLGIAAALTIPYIAALYIVRPSLIKSILLAAATASMFWMLVLTASRSGMIDVVTSVIVTSFFVLRGSSRGRMIGIGIVVALLIAVSFAPSTFWDRMATISGGDSATPSDQVQASANLSTSDRFAVLMRSIDYTATHPVFGLGLGNVGVVGGNELADPESSVGSHNTFAELSAEAGIPALLLFVGLVVIVFKNMTRLGRTNFDTPESAELKLMSRATLASLLSFVVAGCFAHIGYEYFFYTCPVAIAVGLGHVAGPMQTAASAPSPQAPIIQQHPNTAWLQ